MKNKVPNPLPRAVHGPEDLAARPNKATAARQRRLARQAEAARPGPARQTELARPILSEEEKKIVLPKLANGQPVFHRKKNGELIPESIVMRFVSRTVHGAACYSATSRSTSITGPNGRITSGQFRDICRRTLTDPTAAAEHLIGILAVERPPDYHSMSAAELEARIYPPATPAQ